MFGRLRVMSLCWSLLFCSLALAQQDGVKRDRKGREVDDQGLVIMRGPIKNSGVLTLRRVHIISDTVGVESGPIASLILWDSVIEAPLCMRLGPSNNSILRNKLKCATCIDWHRGMQHTNEISGNTCAGR